MNKKGELSNQYAPIVAISFDAIFNKKPKFKDLFFKDNLEATFNEEYKSLTYKLYKNGFNVYIVAFKDLKELDSKLWGKYVFYNDLIEYKDMKDLVFDCRNRYSYYIDTVNRVGLLDNSYTLEQFKELL